MKGFFSHILQLFTKKVEKWFSGTKSKEEVLTLPFQQEKPESTDNEVTTKIIVPSKTLKDASRRQSADSNIRGSHNSQYIVRQQELEQKAKKEAEKKAKTKKFANAHLINVKLKEREVQAMQSKDSARAKMVQAKVNIRKPAIQAGKHRRYTSDITYTNEMPVASHPIEI